MSKKVYYYRIYCNTETSYVYTWDSKKPTVCPNDATHSINTSTITITNKIEESKTVIEEETPGGTPTGGRFRCDGLNIITQPNTTGIRDFSWAYPISVMTLRFNTDEAHRGDIINGYVIPCSFKTYTVNDISPGLSTIAVEDVSGVSVGMCIMVSDTENTEYLGKVVSKDSGGNTITTQHATTLSFNGHAYVSYVSPIGIVTSEVSTGQNVLPCNSTVIQNAKPGMVLCIQSASNEEFLGEVFEVDDVNNTVTIQNDPNNTYPAGSYLYLRIRVVKNYKLTSPMFHVIGEGKIGGSYISSLYVMRIEYTNTDDTVAKDFSWYVELLY